MMFTQEIIIVIIGHLATLIAVFIAIKLDINTLNNKVTVLEKDKLEDKNNLKGIVEDLTKSTNRLHTEVYGLKIEIKHLIDKSK